MQVRQEPTQYSLILGETETGCKEFNGMGLSLYGAKLKWGFNDEEKKVL